MELHAIMGNSVKLDGGAMFGNAPQSLWKKWLPPDEFNRIDLATRALLVKTGTHNILFETGIGLFMEPNLRDRYGVVEDRHVLLDSLAEHGLSHEDITTVIISHLHFDHAGGLFSSREENKEPELLFPNAEIMVSTVNLQRARMPHFRDRASFVPALHKMLRKSGRLKTLSSSDVLKFEKLRVDFFQSDGHTPGMLCSILEWEAPGTEGPRTQKLIFSADLIPGKYWVHLPITMGYDRYPERLIDEKRTLLESAFKENARIFYTHDPDTAVSGISYNKEKQTFSWEEVSDSFLSS
ncbi:MAG: MBL fold metallo-hydrolase [bacterium]|nr:MBL fold metallo-hydrolase [bacterium]